MPNLVDFTENFPRITTDNTKEMLDKGQVKLSNPHLEGMESDHLYHIALNTDTHNLKDMFSDVRFVCMGGTSSRMRNFAMYLKNELNIKLPTGADLIDLAGHGQRYAMYKVGPVLSISHGMGCPSLSILLHEVLKLLKYAECKDVILIRIGTSGGIGVPAGTVVASTNVMNDLLQECHTYHILGKIIRRPCKLDVDLAREIVEVGRQHYPEIQIANGKTMCANDFYEAQARLDGAFCEFTHKDSRDFLVQLSNMGVVNIEMESSIFASMCAHAGVKAAIVCVTLIDRLKEDQVTADKDILNEWQDLPQKIVATFIKQKLGL